MNKTIALSTATTLVTVLTLAISGGSWAEEMSKGMDNMSNDNTLNQNEQKTFSQLDSNKDGKISQDEAKDNADLATKFESIDSNHDNAVDEAEFARFEAGSEKSK
jgi:Ca2+-binding EF-hand superfamily protein